MSLLDLLQISWTFNSAHLKFNRICLTSRADQSVSTVNHDLTFEFEPFQHFQVVPFLLFLAFDPVKYERAEAQVADEHDETDEPSSDHCCFGSSSLSSVTIAAREKKKKGRFFCARPRRLPVDLEDFPAQTERTGHGSRPAYKRILSSGREGLKSRNNRKQKTKKDASGGGGRIAPVVQGMSAGGRVCAAAANSCNHRGAGEVQLRLTRDKDNSE